MLSRHIARTVAPVVARTAAAAAGSSVHRLTAIRAISTSTPLLAALRRSAPLLSLSPINPASYGGGTSGGAHGPDADEIIADEMMKFDPRLAAVAAFITAIMGGCLYWGAQDRSAEKAKQDRAMMEDLKEEMKAKFGVTEAQCEAAAVTASSTDMRAAVVAASAGKKFSPESAGAVFDSNPIIGEDYVLAPYWKRVIAFVVDNLSTNALVFALQMLAVRIRPDLEEVMLTGPTALICSFLSNVLVETFCLMYFDGRTIGKAITGLRVIRQDQEKMTLRTALTESTVRAVCTPLVFVPEVVPLFVDSDCSADRQILHNWASGTIVIDVRAAAQQKREAEEDD